MEKLKRKIINIDESLCNGCGLCIDGCHEGALQLIDGKARMISDLYCDGLGACIGECPVDAITIIERDAAPYDERLVMERMVEKGEATIRAHLNHLKAFDEQLYLKQALDYLKANQINMDLSDFEQKPIPGSVQAPKLVGMVRPHACPGSAERSFAAPASAVASAPVASQLTGWPIQLHLLNPAAAFLKGKDMLLAADCTAFAYADFHSRFLRSHALAIACPKLDVQQETYVVKIRELIDMAQINTLTVLMMEVPCCSGLLRLVHQAVQSASRKIPVKKIIVGIQGEIKSEEWDMA